MNKKNVSIDLVRVVAIIAVVMIHVCAPFIMNFKGSSVEFVFANVFDCLARLGVPLFVMVSGYLMLNEEKEITFKKIFKKILSTFALLYFWSLIYSLSFTVIYPLCNGESIDFILFVKQFIFGHYHLWFLFMIIGLYLITPILRAFVKKQNANIVLYFIVLSLALKFSYPLFEILRLKFSSLNIICEYIKLFNLDVIGSFVTYYLTGWYILNVDIPAKVKKLIYILGIVCAMTTLLLVQIFPKHYALMFKYCSILTYFYSAAVFMFLTRNTVPKTRIGQKLALFSKYSFGVYVIHVFVLSLITSIFPYKNFVLGYIVLKWVLAVAISWAITFLILKIPVLKKGVRG